MTVMEWKETIKYDEQKIFAAKLQLWLEPYTQEVFEKVMNQMENIINNTFALNLLDELYTRTLKEREDETQQIMFSLGHEDEYKFPIKNHCLTHSQSYRDILYDLFIK